MSRSLLKVDFILEKVSLFWIKALYLQRINEKIVICESVNLT